MKPIGAFHRDKNKKGGRCPACKRCLKLRSEELRKRKTPPSILEKECSKCGLTKPIAEFHRDKHHPTGRVAHCKECKKEHYARNGDEKRAKARERWKEMDPKVREERNRRYKDRYQESPERYREYSLKYYHENREEINARVREKRSENPEIYRSYNREWYQKNRDRILTMEYARRAENPELHRESLRKYRDRNRDTLREINTSRAREMRDLAKEFAEVDPGTPWDPGEDAFLLADNGMTVYQKAIELGRTYTSTQWRNSYIRKELGNA